MQASDSIIGVFARKIDQSDSLGRRNLSCYLKTAFGLYSAKDFNPVALIRTEKRAPGQAGPQACHFMSVNRTACESLMKSFTSKDQRENFAALGVTEDVLQEAMKQIDECRVRNEGWGIRAMRRILG